ncbi:MAG TPA: hypothetical protein VFH27_11025 [Longimicrobiaceae bacterium]|nr:hypothetical protein [Longimicrobiaceae bacterium]
MRKTAAAMVPLFLLSGCYGYLPTKGRPLKQSLGVQVYLNTPQDVRLAQVTANNVTIVQGEVVQASAEEVVVSATLLTTSSGYEQLGENATVHIARTNVKQLNERHLSYIRTLGIGAVVVVLTALVRGQVQGGGDPVDPGPPTGQ